MAMKVPPVTPYWSQNQITTANSGSFGPRVDSSDFLTPGQQALPGAINKTAHTLLGLAAGAYNQYNQTPQAPQLSEEEEERLRMQDITDLNADALEYENAQKSFEDEYRNTHKGAAARNAVQDFAAFHQEQATRLEEKWADNPLRREHALSMARNFRIGALARAGAVRDIEEKAHRKEVAESAWTLARQTFADPDSTYAESLGALERAEMTLRVTAGQRWDYDAGDGGQWVGGEPVEEELERRRRMFHTGFLQKLMDDDQTQNARSYLKARAPYFEKDAADLTARIDMMEEGWAALKATRRQQAEGWKREADLNRRYEGLRQATRDFPLEKRESVLMAAIEREPDAVKREALSARIKEGLREESRAQDAEDCEAYFAARRTLKGMSASQKRDWLLRNWQGSEPGYERALTALGGPTRGLKRESPTDKRVVQTLVHVLRNKQLTDTGLTGATLWQLNLSERQFDTLTRLAHGGETKAEKAAMAAAAEDPAFLADADAFIDAIDNGTVGEWKAALDAAERGETGVLVAANGPLDGLLSGDAKKEEGEGGETEPGQWPDGARPSSLAPDEPSSSLKWADEGGEQYGEQYVDVEELSRIARQNDEQLFLELKKKFEAGDLSFEVVLHHGVINLGASAERFADALIQTVSDPEGTLTSLGQVSAGYFCQAFGVDSEYTKYSEAVTEYFASRYGSWEGFKRTMMEDPVGLAADLGSLFTLGGGSLRVAALAARKGATKLPKFIAQTAQGTSLEMTYQAGGALAGQAAGKTAAVLDTAGRGLMRAGDLVDPLALPVAAGSPAVRYVMDKSQIPALVAEYGEKIGRYMSKRNITRAKQIISRLPDAAKTASRVKNAVGISSTVDTIQDQMAD